MRSQRVSSIALSASLACGVICFAVSGTAKAQALEAFQVAQPGDSAQQPVLTLEQAWQRALRQHPDLRMVATERDSAAAARAQAGAWPNPELSAQVEDNRAETRTTTWQWSQPIEGSGKRAARLQAADWAQKQADSQAESRLAQVRANLVQAFHGAAVAQERAQLSAELLELASRMREAAGRRVTAGKAAPLEELKAQVAQTQARSALQAAQGEARVAWQALRQAAGGDLAGFQRAQASPESLPDPQRWSTVLDRVDQANPLRLAEQELGRQRAQAEVERTRANPDWVLQVGVKRDAQLGRNQPMVGVALPLALWDRNQGAHTAALRQVDKAEASLDATRASVRAQAVLAFEQLSSAVSQARSVRDAVQPAAAQALELASKGYELGKFGLLDVLDAQRTLFEVKSQLLSSREQAFRAEARLIELFGDADASPQP